jgi:hypothetical protein
MSIPKMREKYNFDIQKPEQKQPTVTIHLTVFTIWPKQTTTRNKNPGIA